MYKSNLTHGVIITTYNNYDFCKLRLDELERQTLLPKHIVICDDGFFNTEKMNLTFDHYINIAKIPITIIVNEENFGGPAKGRNAGIKYLNNKVDIIHILDPDDEWKPTKIQSYDTSFKKGIDAVLELRGKQNEPNKNLCIEDFQFQNPAILSSLAIRANENPILFSEDKDDIAVEDYDFYLRYLTNFKVITCSSRQTKYNHIAGSLSSNKLKMAKKFARVNSRYFGIRAILNFPMYVSIKLKQYYGENNAKH